MIRIGDLLQEFIKDTPEEFKDVLPNDLYDILTEDEVKSSAKSGIITMYQEKLRSKRRMEYLNELGNYSPYPVFDNIKIYEAYMLSKIEEVSIRDEWNTPPELDKHLKEVWTEFIGYFGGYPELCEKIKPKHKIIIISGPVGSGKTELVKLFRSNPHASFLAESAISIRNSAREKDNLAPTLERYGNLIKVNGPTSDFFGQDKLGLFIDDLGTEENINDYGNQMNLMEQIILDRYNNLKSYPKIHTIITTNLDENGIGQRYGIRFFDRLREQAAMFKIDGSIKSFRGR